MGKMWKGCLYNYTYGKEVTRNPLKGWLRIDNSKPLNP